MLRTWHIHREIKKWEKENPKRVDILDAGSGFGQYAFYLSGRNSAYKILGLDVKDDQVLDCNQFFAKKGRKGVTFQVADLTKYDAKDSFDLCLSVDVMEHILEDELVFQNLCKALRKGGMLLISTPSDQGGSDAEEGDESFIGEHVRNGYNILDIQEKLKRAGFSKTHAAYSYGTPGKISWRLSMKIPISLAGISKFFLLILPFYFILVYPLCLVLNYLDAGMQHSTGTGLIVRAWK